MSRKRGTTSKRQRSRVDTFVVKLMRPIFQSAVILVEAKDEAQAIKRAFRTAPDLGETDWDGSFDPRNYRIALQHVLNADELIEERGLPPSVDSEVCLAAELANWDDTRYMILKADIESGEGETHAQPWLRGCSNLMLADLAMDWREQLAPVEHKGAEGYRGMWDAGQRPEPSERRENIVPFRQKPSKDDDDGDGSS